MFKGFMVGVVLASVLSYIDISASAAAPKEGAADRAPAPQDAKWALRMQDLYRHLIDLVTDLSSDERFNSPARRSAIDKNAAKIAELAHQMNANASRAPDADPSIGLMAGLFEREAKSAVEELKRNHRPYARNLLQGLTSYCIACHTRDASGPNFPALPMTPATETLKPLEKARFFMATRQYDRAHSELERIYAEGRPTETTFEWERAVRYGLVLTVRVKKDPAAALDITERALASKRSPYFLKQDALAWMEQLAAWKEEAPRTPTNEEGLRAEGIRLIAAAHGAQKFPADRAGDVLYLRATSILHEQLRLAPQGKYAPEAFFLLGVAYEALRDLNLGEFHELYYETCIRKAPKEPVAQNCFRKLEQSIYTGYTGSAGTSIPPAIKARLAELQKLVFPTEGIKPPKP